MKPAQPLSHTCDPATSYEAADKMVKSGKLARQEHLIWMACRIDLRTREDFTAKELAAKFPTNLDYYIVQRRLSGLRNKGKIERTGEKRNGCCVWTLTKKGKL